MADYKIIFTGPAGVGKTTAISVLSDGPIKRNGAHVSKMAGVGKNLPTRGINYGLIKLNGDSDVIHLYGTSRKDHDDFKRDRVTEDGLGLILLLDNGRSDPFKDMHFFLETFADFIDQTAVVIGVTRMGIRPEPTIEDYHRELWSSGFNPPILEIDARNRRDVSLLTMSLLYSLDPGLGGGLST